MCSVIDRARHHRGRRANMWRARCKLASGASVTGVALGKKVRQFAKVNALLSELSKTRIGFLRESTKEDIMHMPDTHIEYWI